MTRIAIRHTLSALAALALVSAFAISPATSGDVYSFNVTLHVPSSSANAQAPKGLATQNGSQEPSTNRQFTRMIVKKLDKVRK